LEVVALEKLQLTLEEGLSLPGVLDGLEDGADTRVAEIVGYVGLVGFVAHPAAFRLGAVGWSLLICVLARRYGRLFVTGCGLGGKV
jgi:hypothetical protein